jgi:SAM-dependent methyltransferase
MDASDWNARYDTSELIWKGEPNQFLPLEVADLTPGTAVDLACGEGRNAVWLAKQGWTVTGVDFSEVGVEKGRKLASENDVEATWVVADVTTWEPPETGFDLVAVFYLQLGAEERRESMKTAVRALAVGGTLVLVGHDLLNLTEGHGGPQNPAFLLTAEDIIDDLTAAEVSLDVELVTEKSGRVERTVTTDDGERTAIDTLVRVRRVA